LVCPCASLYKVLVSVLCCSLGHSDFVALFSVHMCCSLYSVFYKLFASCIFASGSTRFRFDTFVASTSASDWFERLVMRWWDVKPYSITPLIATSSLQTCVMWWLLWNV